MREHGRVGADADQREQAGRPDTSLVRRVGQQRPALDRPLQRQRPVPAHLSLQPQPAVEPVQCPGRLLIAVEHPHVEAVAAASRRGVTPGLAALLAGAPHHGHRMARRAQPGGDLLRGRPLGPLAGRVPHAEADGPAEQQRDHEREDGDARGGEGDDRVDPDRQPQGGPPARGAGQADDRGVRGEAGQVAVERAGGARALDGDRVVERRGGPAQQRRVGQRDQADRRPPGQHRLGEPPGLPAGELPDGERRRPEQQRQGRRDTEQRQHRMRQPAARSHRVDLHAPRRRTGEQADPDGHHDSQHGEQAPQQVDRQADPARALILHDQPGSRHGTGLRGHARAAVPVRSWRGGRHLAIVSPGIDHGEHRAAHGQHPAAGRRCGPRGGDGPEPRHGGSRQTAVVPAGRAPSPAGPEAAAAGEAPGGW